MKHEKYFKLPLSRDFNIVWDAEYNRAFDFLSIDEVQQNKIIEALNGKHEHKIVNKITYSDGSIYIDGIECMMIRSWGRLTAGRLNLSSQKAKDIQDSFGLWIVKTLKP